ncbi:TRAP transporter small permease [Proteiniclasticum sp. SCR006]|uniref:TRAP transporter small permease n=1 Tax=Proteiniclasticum aestuarii TaxID=2817862 RepID=A0A939KIE8_9CLOT|nr:TRAP transporter small permease subunit [Proteiniclasticum aestuarii]MBO1264073.1 TRAP transporter small permease [Proteiniclasticum aestuarii]
MVEKALDRMFHVINIINRLLLVTIFVIMWIVIFGRYFLSKTPVWGEELVLFSMLWVGMLSAAEALRNDLHIKITVMDRHLSDKVKNILEIIYDIIIIVICSALLYHGVQLTIQNVDISYMGLKISEAFAYAAMPVGYALFIIVKVEKYYRKFRKTEIAREAE